MRYAALGVLVRLQLSARGQPACCSQFMDMAGGMWWPSAPLAPHALHPLQIVLADREQDATMARLQYYTRYLTRQDSRRQVGESRPAACMWAAWRRRGRHLPRVSPRRRLAQKFICLCWLCRPRRGACTR